MDELLDSIGDLYEAAFVPELWTPTLDRISRLTGHDGGAVIAIPPDGPPSFVASESAKAAAAFIVDNNLATGNSFYKRTMALNYDGFVIDEDIFPDLNDYYRDPAYLVLAKQFNAGFGTGTNIVCPTGLNIGVRFARFLTGEPTRRESAVRLDSLRPHLARATLTAARVAQERATAAVATLDALGVQVEQVNAAASGQDRTDPTSGPSADVLKSMPPAAASLDLSPLLAVLDRQTEILERIATLLENRPATPAPTY